VIRACVLTAAKNAALSLLPQQQRRDEELEISVLNIASDEAVYQKIAASEEYAALLRCVRLLPSPYREAILQVHIHERSIPAAADILGRSQEAVRKQLQRGKKLLIEICRKEGMFVEEE